MGIETLALNGVYGMKLDDRCRIPFPSNFRDEIDQKIGGTDYYLLIRPKRKNGSTILRIEPIAMNDYDELVKQMNSRDEKDSERMQFFKQYRVDLDDQGRINLTSFVSEFVRFQRRKEYFYVGRGNYCELLKLSKEELTDLMLKEEQAT